jgi:hypothetical protein
MNPHKQNISMQNYHYSIIFRKVPIETLLTAPFTVTAAVSVSTLSPSLNENTELNLERDLLEAV